MNVLFLTAWYPTKEAPVAGVFVREHARAASLHHDVTVLHIVATPTPDPFAWRVVEERDPSLTEGIRTLRVIRGRFGRSYPLKVYSAFRAGCAARPNLVHAHIYEAAVPGVLVGRRLGAPVVCTEQWTGFTRGVLGWRQKAQARFALSHVTCLMPVSHALADALLPYAGADPRVELVPNVVDRSVFHPAPRGGTLNATRRLAFVGLLDPTEHKNLPLLLEALRRFGTTTDWRLDVVGDGPSRRRCEELAASLGLADRVSFHGIRPKAEVASLMREADLFVLPSKWECLPCVVAEALASGTPVLATDVGGTPELISPENGLIVPPNDPAALRDGLAAMLAKAEQFNRPEVAAAAASRYSLEAVGSQLDAIYRDLAGRPARDRPSAKEPTTVGKQ
jgi:glycosyltransferase involved in cell wall biosynthesis